MMLVLTRGGKFGQAPKDKGWNICTFNVESKPIVRGGWQIGCMPTYVSKGP